jgi:SagB-type dehydrogenase family enzyme
VSGGIERALAYHERTKHHPHRFARSLGYLDWKNQPDPFRRYEGAELIALARPELLEEGPTLDECYAPERIAARAIDEAAIAQLLFDSLALSAWKVYGASRWSLRCNPSSGNLHPTEAYLVREHLEHYAPYLHALERRGKIESERGGAGGGVGGGGELIVGLTSIHWREAWKYGERAYRYCQHDVGHAIAAVAFAAAALGWRTRIVEAADREIARLLGVETQRGIEAEHPDVLLAIGPSSVARRLPELSVGALAGEPNRLSAEHVHWEVIDDVAEACTLAQAPEPSAAIDPSTSASAREAIAEPPARPIPARRIFRTRRSAVELDGVTRLDASTFFRIAQRLMPGRVPFSTFWWRPAIHVAFFVHRVDDVAPGVYLLVRDPASEPALRAAFDPTFEWRKPDGCPADLPLYLLGEGDVRRVAGVVCCGQEIAADGAFAVAMLGDMTRLSEHGAWFYRRLHFEAGAIGQVLYLEAEAAAPASFRGTGIGCFFDDLISEALRLRTRDFTTIYCFTAGGAVEDLRIQSEPAYLHLG